MKVRDIRVSGHLIIPYSIGDAANPDPRTHFERERPAELGLLHFIEGENPPALGVLDSQGRGIA